jgi:hypothetical protein
MFTPPRTLPGMSNSEAWNSPSLAVALTCGIGSSSLNAEVNAFERLQIVRDDEHPVFAFPGLSPSLSVTRFAPLLVRMPTFEKGIRGNGVYPLPPPVS